MQTNPNANPNQDPNNNPNQDPSQNPNQDPNNGGGTGAPQISLEDMLAGIGQQLGGSPLEDEKYADATEVEKAILEEQYAQRIERAFDKMQKEVKGKIEDATDNQIHEIGMAFMKGDIGAGIDAIRQALRHAEEVNDNDQEQVNLHVEGGSGGKQSEDGKNEGLSGVLSSIANTYGQGNRA